MVCKSDQDLARLGRITLCDNSPESLKLFLLLWQTLKWQRMSICKCEKKIYDLWFLKRFTIWSSFGNVYLLAFERCTNEQSRINVPDQPEKNLKIYIFWHSNFCHHRKNIFCCIRKLELLQATELVMWPISLNSFNVYPKTNTSFCFPLTFFFHF